MLCLALSACFGGWNIKEPARLLDGPPAKREDTLRYKISPVKGFTPGNGEDGLRAGFEQNGVFSQAVEEPEKPDSGLWVQVSSYTRDPSGASLVLTYLMYATAAVTLGVSPVVL